MARATTSATRMIGFTDLPAKNDDLSFKAYCEGLAEFLAECATPMTVAVQGSWGAGKTTIMNLVAADLDAMAKKDDHPRIGIIRFETWQYSQFSMGDDLVTSLISTLGLELGRLSKESSKQTEALKGVVDMFKSLSRLGRSAGFAAAKAAAEYLPPIAGDSIKAALTEIEPSTSQAPGDAAVALKDLKQGFEKAVRESGYSRIVVFVDDLDRMSPERAVELMEAIKIFLDAENCVFVLAMDLDVVRAGSGARLGTELDEKKAQAFFDKMVQVPFLVPEAPDVSRFLMEGLKAIGVPMELGVVEERFSPLVSTSVGRNPRSIKRLLNTYVLLRKIADRHGVAEHVGDLDLFAVLCLQTAYQDEYDGLQKALADDSSETAGITSMENISEALGIETDETGKDKGGAFAKLFLQRFTKDGDSTVDIDRLANAMDLSKVTSRTAVRPDPADLDSVGDRDNMETSAKAKNVPEKIVNLASQLVDDLLESGSIRSVSAQAKNADRWNLYSAPHHRWGTKAGLLSLGRTQLTLRFLRKKNASDEPTPGELKNLREQVEQSMGLKSERLKIGAASGAEFKLSIGGLRTEGDVRAIAPIVAGILSGSAESQ